MRQKIFRLVADLRFAIFLILLISFFSIIGTVIEQDQSIELYKINYPISNPVFGFLTWDRILYFGLNHVYKTWWFFLLIFLFGSSLICCTFLQQLPTLKLAYRCQFFRTPQSFYNLKISTILKNLYFNRVLAKIKTQNYSIFQQKNSIYCYKGLNGRIAPILVHLSLILILLGTIIGSLFGFTAQEIIPKTEHFHIQNILTSGEFTSISNISARVNDFWMIYTPDKRVSQFYSDISILSYQGNEINRQTISVNYPLIYKNIYYYQTDWSLLGLRFQNLKNEIIEYPLINILSNSNKVWLTWIANNDSLQKGIIIIIDNLEGYCSIYNKTGEFLGNLELNETNYFSQLISLLEIISSTGLQIKEDKGLFVIYSGFFFLMISTLISYLSYSQIWIFQKNNKLFIGGTTNRALFNFELNFFKFIQ